MLKLKHPVLILVMFVLVVGLGLLTGCAAGSEADTVLDSAAEAGEEGVDTTLPDAQLPAPDVTEKCYDDDPHPIGSNIAEIYTADYQQVMTWYCEGHAFDDIIMALETHDLIPEYETEVLLEMKAGDQTWDAIWKEIGLTE